MPKKRQSGQHGTKLAQERFLQHFADHFNIRKAAKAAKVSHQSVYNWLKADAEFARRFADSKQQAIDDLEAEARRRAVEGTLEPVFHQGRKCGTVRKFSDTLLIFLLKGLKPDVYRERFEHSGPGGGAIQLAHAEAINTALDDAERLELLELRALARSGHAGAVRHEGQRGPMANGAAPSQIEPSVN